MKPLAPAALSVLLAACAAAQLGGVIHPTVSGSIRIDRGGSASEWSPDRCVSGDLAYFAGFDFQSSRDGAQLRAAQSAVDGPVVRWSDGSTQPAIIVRAADCAALEVDAHPTAWQVNDVREFAGHVELHCTLADSTRIDGRIDVDHCH